jgi:hypothetical protein
MKPKLAALLFFSVLLLFGCVVQSLRPYFTAANRVSLPEGMAGEWELVSEHGTARQGYPPWTFSEKELALNDGNGNAASLEIAFFRLGDQLYLDSLPEARDEQISNRFWNWHIAPMHLLCRVDRADDTLTLLPLNYEWLNETVKAEGGLPFICPEEGKNDWRIYTASPAEWEAFLQKHAAAAEAFPAKLAVVLRRVPPAPAPPAPSAPAAAPNAPPPPPPSAPVAP